MSFGSASAGSAPKLQTLSIPSAEDAVLAANVRGYGLSDTNYATGYTAPLVSAAQKMLGALGGEMGGGISSQATGALKTAGLGDVAKNIVGKNEFQTARNLGQPILAKEQRDRNYADTILGQPYFAKRSFTLSPQDVLDIVTANTGNVNAYRQGIYQTNVQQSNLNTLQSAQNFGALTNLVSGLATNYSRYQSPYTNPFGYAYSSPQGSSYYGPQGDVFGFGGDNSLSVDMMGGV